MVWHVVSSPTITTKTKGGEEATSIYIPNIQVDVLQTAFCPPSPPCWLVWAINRPPLLWPSTESICLHPFIHHPAWLAACLPVSISVCPFTFLFILRLFLSLSKHCVPALLFSGCLTGRRADSATAVMMLQWLLYHSKKYHTFLPHPSTRAQAPPLVIWHCCSFIFLIFAVTHGAILMQPPFQPTDHYMCVHI